MTTPTVSTPIRVSRFARELSHYDPVSKRYLLEGLTLGFKIGYDGPIISVTSKNLKSASSHPDVVDKYLKEEVSLGRIKGPFPNQPFPIFRINPLGIVPKKTVGKFRAILNLSAPPGKSVNEFINKEDFKLQYTKVDTAIDFILSLGRGCMLSKVDIQDAFRILPVSPEDWYLLGMEWNGKFYHDCRLTMGSRSSPYIFDCVSSALEWICKHNYEVEYICHLLNDFLAAESVPEKGNALSKIK